MSFGSCKSIGTEGSCVSTMAGVDFLNDLKMASKMSLFSSKVTMWQLVAQQVITDVVEGKKIKCIS